MERLTRRINGVVVYVGAKNPYSTGQIPCEVEPAGVREMMDRLAAYEDTGRMPEEVTAIQCTLTEYHKVADPLLRAQADGRLVVHGRWAIDEFWHYCTVCREYGKETEGDAEIVDLLKYGTPYCPNCLAKMDGGDGDAVD